MAEERIVEQEDEQSNGWLPPRPDTSHLITEDETPVDNWNSEKQQRLLTEPLYSSWVGPGEGRTFVAAADVGLFLAARNPAIVPDMFLSLDITVPEDWWEQRAYFVWELGKVPEVAIEIVSNRKGNELGSKLSDYARMGIFYYIVYDPRQHILKDDVLQAYVLTPRREYEEISPTFLAGIGLGLTLWHGVYEGREDTWLRWQDTDDNLILTGAERATLAESRAQTAESRAQTAESRAQTAEERAERLAQQLRELGVEPE